MQALAGKEINLTVITEHSEEGNYQHNITVQPLSEYSGDSVIISVEVLHEGKPVILQTDDEFNGLPWKQEVQIPFAAVEQVKEAIDSIVKYLKEDTSEED